MNRFGDYLLMHSPTLNIVPIFFHTREATRKMSGKSAGDESWWYLSTPRTEFQLSPRSQSSTFPKNYITLTYEHKQTAEHQAKPRG